MRKTLLGLISIVLTAGAGSFVEAGWNDKSLSGVEVDIQYVGNRGINSRGEAVYKRGDFVRYVLTFRNNGNRPLKRFPLMGGLYWLNQESCTLPDGRHVTFNYDAPLPGSSISPTRHIDLPKGGTAQVSIGYSLPADVCPNRADVRVDQLHGGGKNPSYRLPQSIEIVE